MAASIAYGCRHVDGRGEAIVPAAFPDIVVAIDDLLGPIVG